MYALPSASVGTEASAPILLSLLPPPLLPAPFPAETSTALAAWTPGTDCACRLYWTPTCPMEYEFNFQLEIRGPCLLAGERSCLDPDGAGTKIPGPGVGRGREGGKAGRPRWMTACSQPAAQQDSFPRTDFKTVRSPPRHGFPGEMSTWA